MAAAGRSAPRDSHAHSAGALHSKPPGTVLRPPHLKPSPEAWPQAERRANASWRQDSGAKPVTPHWSQQPKDAPPPRTVLRTSVHGFSTFNVHISPLGGASKM